MAVLPQVEYVLHKCNRAFQDSLTSWQRYAVLEYTTICGEKHLTNSRYFESLGDAEAYKQKRERMIDHDKH